MHSEELIASGDLAADGLSAVTRQIRAFHGGVAERVFKSVGIASEPVRVLHDGIADAVYGAVGLIGAGVVKAGVRVASNGRAGEVSSFESTPRGRFVLGAVNGAFGDAIAERSNGLAIQMAVRANGAAVRPTQTAFAEAFPDATPRLAVFLHGLCETEDAWGRRPEARRPDEHVTYAERLRVEAGYTPVYVRYNGGLHISENGRLLAGLLDQIDRCWPVDVAEIALIGHSMGGLIARSACHYGAESDAVGKVRDLVFLGAPHTGSWLERAAHATRAGLRRLPETRALGDALGARSAGVRDLFHGYLVDEDWDAYDPDAFACADGSVIPFLETANHYFVAATLTRDPASPIANVFGDMLVGRPSAWGERGAGEPLQFDLENYCCLGPANHFDLLNHPAIADQLVSWLSADEAAALSARSGRVPARAALAARSVVAARARRAPTRSRPRWS
ncbi:MAG: esterase/lipase family protein [Solirubrobacteraceae bacterium]